MWQQCFEEGEFFIEQVIQMLTRIAKKKNGFSTSADYHRDVKYLLCYRSIPDERWQSFEDSSRGCPATGWVRMNMVDEERCLLIDKRW